jgi:putative acyl-CoA dehydrogenase
MEPRTSLPGHEVTNQPPARGDRDLRAGDPVLGTHAKGAETGDHGTALGTVQAAKWAREANTRLPELRVFDAGGRRLDEVAFTDGYHRLMALGLRAGLRGGALDRGQPPDPRGPGLPPQPGGARHLLSR